MENWDVVPTAEPWNPHPAGVFANAFARAAVPEPNAALLLLIGVGALLRVRRATAAVFVGLLAFSPFAAQALIIVGALETPGCARDIEVVGDLAYVADTDCGPVRGTPGLRIIDVSNPAAPVLLGALDTSRDAEDVAVVGGLAYLAAGHSGLRVIDVSDPAAPVEIGALGTAFARDVEVVDGLAYVAGGSLQVIDVSDPPAPVEIGRLDTPDSAYDVEVVGGLAYVADYSTGRKRPGLRIIDVSNPTAPVLLGSLDTKSGSDPESATDVEVVGRLAYVATLSSIHIIDVSNPALPELRTRVRGRSRHVEVVDGILYSGDLWLSDLSNPVAPVQLGAIPADGAYDVEVVGGLAYVATHFGLHIVDVSNPVEAPLELGGFDTPAFARDVEVVGGIAYTADGLPVYRNRDTRSSLRSAGLRMIDVTNPAAPVFIGALDIPGAREREASCTRGSYAQPWGPRWPR